MPTLLRADVKVTASADGVELFDPLTGFRFELACPVRALLTDGGPASAESDELLRSMGMLDEPLSLEDIRARQLALRLQIHQEGREERLKALLAHCTSEVPYYRERASEYSSATADTLHALPLLRKTDLRSHFPHGLISKGFDVEKALAERRVELSSTSGTTSERLQVLVDLELDTVPADYASIWGLPESDETPRTAVLTGPLCVGTECHLGKLPMEERIRADYTLVLNSADDLFSMKPELVANIVEEMHRFRPEILLVNPMYLHWFGRRAREQGLVLPPVRLILASYQYLSVFQRRALRDLFQAPVRGFYAATDMGGAKLGIECGQGRWHVREDHCLIEVVGDDGRPVARGELGAVAATTLVSRVMPLVRYLVGDVAKLSAERCGCAVNEWTLFELHGRAKDMLFFDKRWITTKEVDDALSVVSGIDFYQCVQGDDHTLNVQLIATPGAAVSEGDVKSTLMTLCGDIRVQVSSVRRLDPEPSLKFRLTKTHPQRVTELR